MAEWGIFPLSALNGSAHSCKPTAFLHAVNLKMWSSSEHSIPNSSRNSCYQQTRESKIIWTSRFEKFNFQVKRISSWKK